MAHLQKAKVCDGKWSIEFEMVWVERILEGIWEILEGPDVVPKMLRKERSFE